jgi:glycerophosphoryl diester phosphodiesterase
MAAFRGAILEAGANAIETDIHLSKDEVVVLSHDAVLDRIFGVPGKVSDYTWAELQEFRTKRQPSQKMCSFAELLEWLAQDDDTEETPSEASENIQTTKIEDVWVLLDIKLDNDPDTVMRRLAETIRAAPISRKHPWDERIVLGIWAVSSSSNLHGYC